MPQLGFPSPFWLVNLMNMILWLTREIYHIVRTIDRVTDSIKTITNTSLCREFTLPAILLGRL